MLGAASDTLTSQLASAADVLEWADILHSHIVCFVAIVDYRAVLMSGPVQVLAMSQRDNRDGAGRALLLDELAGIGWNRITDGFSNDDAVSESKSCSRWFQIRLGEGTAVLKESCFGWELFGIKDEPLVEKFGQYMTGLYIREQSIAKLVYRVDCLHSKLRTLNQMIEESRTRLDCTLFATGLRVIMDPLIFSIVDIPIVIDDENFDLLTTLTDCVGVKGCPECAICAEIWDPDGNPPRVECSGCAVWFHLLCWTRWAEGNPGALKRVFASIQGKCPSCDQPIKV